MAKSTPQICYQNGNGDILYKSNTFIYELTITHIYKKESRVELESCRHISSQVPLKFKKTYLVKKLSKWETEIREIEMIGAPKQYIENNGFRLTELTNKKSKK